MIVARSPKGRLDGEVSHVLVQARTGRILAFAPVSGDPERLEILTKALCITYGAVDVYELVSEPGEEIS